MKKVLLTESEFEKVKDVLKEVKFHSWNIEEAFFQLEKLKSAFQVLKVLDAQSDSPLHNMINKAIENDSKMGDYYNNTFSKSFDELDIDEWVDGMKKYIRHI